MDHTSKPPLIILAGPTAVGKTALSVQLAGSVGGEIVSADSMQVYRHMDIGSAKIRPDQMRGIPHHLIDILDPREDFNVVVFQQKCRECFHEIYSRGHIPILTGGTGFYIQAVLRDIDFTENEEDGAFRREMEGLARAEGTKTLHDRLKEVDPAAAEAIPHGNVKRVIRALEYYRLTGQPISEHNARERARGNAYNACYFVLNDNREKIYKRIDERVDNMLAQGLVEEVRQLREMGCRRGHTAMQGLGYKEILDFLDGLTGLDEAVARIKRDTRHFAKRQLTWFRREPEVIWADRRDFPAEGQDEALCKFMLGRIKEKIQEEKWIQFQKN